MCIGALLEDGIVLKRGLKSKSRWWYLLLIFHLKRKSKEKNPWPPHLSLSPLWSISLLSRGKECSCMNLNSIRTTPAWPLIHGKECCCINLCFSLIHSCGPIVIECCIGVAPLMLIQCIAPLPWGLSLKWAIQGHVCGGGLGGFSISLPLASQSALLFWGVSVCFLDGQVCPFEGSLSSGVWTSLLWSPLHP